MNGFDFERAEAIVKAASAGASPSPGSFGGEGRSRPNRPPGRPGRRRAGRYGPCDRSLKPSPGFSAPLSSDRPDGLWPTTVCDEGGRLLGLVYSDLESLEPPSNRDGASINPVREVYGKG